MEIKKIWVSPEKEKLYTVQMNEGEQRMFALFGLITTNSDRYNKLTSPKERLQFIKEQYPDSVSPIHLKWLELEKKLNDKDLLKVDYFYGIINLCSDLINLEWSEEDKYWTDGSASIYDIREIKTRELKSYILNTLKDADTGEDQNINKLIREIKNAFWLK